MKGTHEHRLRVRYGETDQMGRAHHASYVLYLEEARTRMMADRGWSYAEMERRGLGLPVRRMEVRFRQGAGFDEEIVVRTRVTGRRHASITFGCEVVSAGDGSRLAEATVELACVDLTSDPPHPVALPKGLLEILAD